MSQFWGIFKYVAPVETPLPTADQVQEVNVDDNCCLSLGDLFASSSSSAESGRLWSLEEISSPTSDCSDVDRYSKRQDQGHSESSTTEQQNTSCSLSAEDVTKTSDSIESSVDLCPGGYVHYAKHNGEHCSRSFNNGAEEADGANEQETCCYGQNNFFTIFDCASGLQEDGNIGYQGLDIPGRDMSGIEQEGEATLELQSFFFSKQRFVQFL